MYYSDRILYRGNTDLKFTPVQYDAFLQRAGVARLLTMAFWGLSYRSRARQSRGPSASTTKSIRCPGQAQRVVTGRLSRSHRVAVRGLGVTCTIRVSRG